MEKDKGKTVRDLTQGPVPQTLMLFALPILGSNVLSTCYNLVDMAIIGHFVGSVGLSAVSIGGDILHVILLMSNGFSNAAQIVISRLVGKKDREAVSKSVGTIFSFVFLFALFLTALMVLLHGPILRAVNTPEEAWNDAVRYSVCCFFGIIFTFGYGLLGAMLRGMGDSKHPMMFITVASVVNVTLDLVFVGLCRLGTLGAALATVIGQGSSFIWALGYLYRHRARFDLEINLRTFLINKKILADYIQLAIPMCLQKTLIQLANLYINSFIYAYGVVVTALTGVGTKLGTLCQMFSNAMLQGGAAMVGQNIGAKKPERVKQVFYTNLVYGLSVWVIISGITLLFREQIFGIFTSDPAVLEMTVIYMPALILRYFMFCQRCPFMALINGIGKPKINYLLGIIDGIVFRVGFSLLFGIVLGWGVQGFWYGNALGGFAPMFVGSVYFFSGRWKKDANLEAA